MLRIALIITVIATLGIIELSFADTAEPTTVAPTATNTLKPYRTFVTIKRYNLLNSGVPTKPTSNVRLDIKFPGGAKVQLPEGGQFWAIGNQQTQEINRTFEIPWTLMKNDGFNFEIQFNTTGKKILPCRIEVTQLSQFNRTYICRTDVAFQRNQNIATENVADAGIEVRVFSDVNSTPSDIPQDALTLR